MQTYLRWAFIILVITALTACGKTDEKIHEHLEAAVELEEGFLEQQAPLRLAEKEEYERYEALISQNVGEKEEIEALAAEAIEQTYRREEIIALEKESMTASYEAFKNIESYVEKYKDPDMKALLEEMMKTMSERYHLYETIAADYVAGIELDRQLYEMLKDESTSIESLQEQIERINAKYEQINEAKSEFNERTKEYNEQKREFYNGTKLNVQYSTGR